MAVYQVWAIVMAKKITINSITINSIDG